MPQIPCSVCRERFAQRPGRIRIVCGKPECVAVEARRQQRRRIHGRECPGLADMKAGTPAGECVMCEERLRGKQRVICGAAECRTGYQRVYGRDRRNGKQQMTFGALVERSEQEKFVWCAGGAW